MHTNILCLCCRIICQFHTMNWGRSSRKSCPPTWWGMSEPTGSTCLLLFSLQQVGNQGYHKDKLCLNRELCTVDNLLTMMSDVVRCSKKRLQLRNLCCEERPWRCQVHRCMAQAHLAAVHQDLETLQQRWKGTIASHLSSFARCFKDLYCNEKNVCRFFLHVLMEVIYSFYFSNQKNIKKN